MGRTRTKTKKSVPVVSSASESPSKSAPSIPSLLEKAQELIIQCDYDLARMFVKRILDREPAHVEAREMMGIVLLETGQIDDARSMFLSLIPPHVNAPTHPPPSAYLYLAQLTDDDPHTGLSHYQHAIDILVIQLKGKERADDAQTDESELKSNIVRAYVGMVEIWMDPSYDLCFDPNAEQTCESLLDLALQIDPGNSEALQALASVRMSQNRPDEAKEYLSLAWSAWKDIEDPTDPRLPPLSTRLSLVKLFLELSSFTPALLVLHGIMASDDQEVEGWYLEGWCFFLMAEEAKENEAGKLDELSWEELAKDSRDCLETCQMLFTNQKHPDAPLLEHVQELIGKLDSLGIKTLPADDADESWEDEGGSEDSDGDVDMS
ncbi:hypothetical protein PILCRDRAFT_817621 [Piloderma croceum F 1598]|uniref:TPR-like protein n=1 Tax=Piloderma croceum (strain F 1598) TaxID=765440 RepID=A0A0C3G2H5_PILCF|nr:hypothetical protein PILCRDRAFT_817621 [Piloderma croceum F 1598]